jgi:hypothetical protein
MLVYIVWGRQNLPSFIGPFQMLSEIGGVPTSWHYLQTCGFIMYSTSLPHHSKDDGRIQPPPVPIIVDGELSMK